METKHKQICGVDIYIHTHIPICTLARLLSKNRSRSISAFSHPCNAICMPTTGWVVWWSTVGTKRCFPPFPPARLAAPKISTRGPRLVEGVRGEWL